MKAEVRGRDRVKLARVERGYAQQELANLRWDEDEESTSLNTMRAGGKAVGGISLTNLLRREHELGFGQVVRLLSLDEAMPRGRSP